MKLENKTQLILSLIKDDLVNSKLVNALNAAGLNATDYFLHLSDTVFALMGIEETPHDDELYTYYLYLCNRAQNINLKTERQGLDKLAHEIYVALLKWISVSGNA